MTAAVDEQATTDESLGIPWHGVLAPEGKWSGDGRRFGDGSLTFRDLPLPLTWQKVSDDGHKGSVVVAKMERLARVDGEMRASGHYLATPEADEAIGLVAEFGKFGVSVDADDAEFEIEEDSGKTTFTRARISSASMVPIPAFAEAWVSLGDAPESFMPEDCDPASPDYEACMMQKGMEPGGDTRVGGMASAAKPVIEVDPEDTFSDIVEFADVAPGRTEDGPGWLTHPVDTDRLRDYWVSGPGAAKIGWGTPGDFNRCRAAVAEYVKPEFLSGYCANRHFDALGFWPGRPVAGETHVFEGEPAPALTLVAGSGWCAPSEWFDDPKLDTLTPLTVTEEGRVFGHLAGWTQCHIGPQYKGMCVSPPHSESGYAYFMAGQVLTDKGPVNVGNISMDTGHAGPGKWRGALAHYDNTGIVVADIAVGEDEHGIWMAGSCRQDTPAEKIAALRAAKISGDWRQVRQNSELELVAALAVNSGGFPIPRPRASVSAGMQESLVAAGIVDESDQTYSDVRLDLSPEAVAEFARAVEAEMHARVERRERMEALAPRFGGE